MTSPEMLKRRISPQVPQNLEKHTPQEGPASKWAQAITKKKKSKITGIIGKLKERKTKDFEHRPKEAEKRRLDSQKGEEGPADGGGNG